ncbi:sensor histidine kinase [Tenggerimyces flavus]|uniref:DUF3558 domain-containing protein n=1 Tax=Tenggerimyces flavus TaxID=1708749 RepID=A0ABV7Y6P2_9ACTN|nr:hypothetical protein [Tenggerimyces flavus]MBM7788418.1 hypothetical protein [Tenggerimyces flavus]
MALLGVVIAATACTSTTDEPAVPEPRLPSPDACALVSPATLDEVVGPAVADPTVSETVPNNTRSRCGWDFSADTSGADPGRRPFTRKLSVATEASSEQDCDEYATYRAGGGKDENVRPVEVPGTRAWIDSDAVDEELLVCRPDGVLEVELYARDWANGKQVRVDRATIERILLAVGREANAAWSKVPTVEAVYTPPPSETPVPEPTAFDLCALVPADTLAAAGTPKETVGFRAEAPRAAACDWSDNGEPFEVRPDQVSRAHAGLSVSLRVHDDANDAELEVRQWAHGWSAKPVSLGDLSATSTVGNVARIAVAAGRYQLTFLHFGPRPPAQVEASVLRVARELVTALPAR